MKNGKVKLLEGGLIGAVLGVAAGIFLASSDSGKKLGADIKEKSADFYASLAPKLKKMKKMGEAEYKKFVENAAESYSKAKKLTAEEAAEIRTAAEKSWDHLKKHLS